MGMITFDFINDTDSPAAFIAEGESGEEICLELRVNGQRPYDPLPAEKVREMLLALLVEASSVLAWDHEHSK